MATTKKRSSSTKSRGTASRSTSSTRGKQTSNQNQFWGTKSQNKR